MRASVTGVSERRSCQVLGVSRAGLHRTGAPEGRGRRADPPWTERLHQLIQQHPTCGYRRLRVLLRCQHGILVNRKAVYRILKRSSIAFWARRRGHAPSRSIMGPNSDPKPEK